MWEMRLDLQLHPRYKWVEVYANSMPHLDIDIFFAHLHLICCANVFNVYIYIYACGSMWIHVDCQHNLSPQLEHCPCCHQGVVAVITVLEVWVAAVTFLVMNGSNIQGLLGVNEIQAVLASWHTPAETWVGHGWPLKPLHKNLAVGDCDLLSVVVPRLPKMPVPAWYSDGTKSISSRAGWGKGLVFLSGRCWCCVDSTCAQFAPALEDEALPIMQVLKVTSCVWWDSIWFNGDWWWLNGISWALDLLVCPFWLKTELGPGWSLPFQGVHLGVQRHDLHPLTQLGQWLISWGKWRAIPQCSDYPLVNIQKAMERSTILNGKTHYFYDHFQ